MKKKLIELQNKYPNLSSLMCYIKLMKGKSDSVKRKYFHLIDREDHVGVNKEELLNSIFAIN